MKVARIFTLLMVMVLTYSFFGTSCSKKYNYTSVEPDYSSFEQTAVMEVRAHVSPYSARNESEIDYCTQEAYNDIAECGITTIIGHNEMYAMVKDGKTAEERALEYSQNAGINYIVRPKTNVLTCLENGDEQGFYKEIEKFSSYNSFKGIFIADEPSISRFESLSAMKKSWDKLLPEKDFYINLLPCVATASVLGISGDETYGGGYIRKFINTVNPNYVSFDNYVLKEDGWGDPSIESSFLLNLQICADEAKTSGLPLLNHIQTYKFSTGYRAPDEQEFRFNILCSMAYGVKGYQLFSYWNHSSEVVGLLHNEPALVTRTGEKTPAYHALKKVNSEVHAMDHVYLNYNWIDTMCITGSNSNGENKCFKMLEHSLNSHERIKKATASEDLIIGAFEDSNKNQAFMVVNFADPGYKDKKNNVEITFNGASKAVIYIKGERREVPIEKGKLSLELDPGDGAFVVPLL